MKQVEIMNQLEGIRSRTFDCLNDLSQSQLDAQPPGTENDKPWSLGEIFMHIAIDEIYLRELIS